MVDAYNKSKQTEHQQATHLRIVKEPPKKQPRHDRSPGKEPKRHIPDETERVTIKIPEEVYWLELISYFEDMEVIKATDDTITCVAELTKKEKDDLFNKVRDKLISLYDNIDDIMPIFSGINDN